MNNGDKFSSLTTEGRNPRTMNIDKMSTLDMVKTINDEDKTVAFAVEKVLPEIARAVDMISAAIDAGGRLIYVGAGTSGRLGVLDASECPPTYGVSPQLVRGVIAGGDGAVFRSVEGAEDNAAMGAEAMRAVSLSEKDVVCGISAAGRAPFVVGAINEARRTGACTVGVTNNPDSEFSKICDITIAAVVGAEVITGSTRMKAGTAQKMILNMLSTGAMVKTGKVMENLMINVAPTNEKLTERARRIICQLSGCDYEIASELLDKHGSIRGALFALGKE